MAGFPTTEPDADSNGQAQDVKLYNESFKNTNWRRVDFVDLFAGLGGFHVALARLRHKCVFACEIDDDLRQLYKLNFGLLPSDDIRNVVASQVPKHNILCAGFPCQPFSKAGDQKGLKCRKWGDLFSHVMRIVRHHLPENVILENVPNLARHNNGDTWSLMERALRAAGYNVKIRTLSPHKFGIPQIRERVFIVASRHGLEGFRWPEKKKGGRVSVQTVLNKRTRRPKRISNHLVRCLRAWQNFLRRYPKDEDLPTFPIWSMEFGATYPFETTTPHAIGPKRLGRYRGSHGQPLTEVSIEERMGALPSYAQSKRKRFPEWKVEFIKRNRELYSKHKRWIDEWLPRILPFPASRQKLEWNCGRERRSIWRHILQIRASGVRVKKATSAPALVAMTTTQVPIIGWERRYMTPRECARLQSLRELRHLPKAWTKAHKALGNAVNANIVEMIARALVQSRKNGAFPQVPGPITDGRVAKPIQHPPELAGVV